MKVLGFDYKTFTFTKIQHNVAYAEPNECDSDWV